jgi:hypothetical protein
MKFWLIEDPPTSWAAVAELKGRAERGAERGRGQAVPRRGTRTDDQIAVDDLANHVLRKSNDISLGCRTPGGQRHSEG